MRQGRLLQAVQSRAMSNAVTNVEPLELPRPYSIKRFTIPHSGRLRKTFYESRLLADQVSPRKSLGASEISMDKTDMKEMFV